MLSISIIVGSISTLLADTINQIIVLVTVTFSIGGVVVAVVGAVWCADGLFVVEILVLFAGLATAIDQVEVGEADASSACFVVVLV